MLPLVVSPVINNIRVTKMLVDGGSGLNLISVQLMEKLQISEERLEPTGSFQGVNPGSTQPLGKVALPVTFGTRDNYHTQDIVFDVVDIPLPYNGILGRPALAKFMAIPHHAYNVLKMPSHWGVLTVKADAKDAVLCVEQIFKAAAAAAVVPDDADAHEAGGPSRVPPGKKACASPGTVPGEGAAGVPAPKKKLFEGERQLSKKVALDGDATRFVTIDAKLNPK